MVQPTQGGPTITDWIGSVGTALGFLAAAAGVVYTGVRNRSHAQRAQAESCDFWIRIVKVTPLEGEDESRLPLQVEFEVSISNVSNLALHGAALNVTFPYMADASPKRYPIGTIPPQGIGSPTTVSGSVTIKQASTLYSVDPGFLERDTVMALYFHDASGNVWTRSSDGQLFLATRSARQTIQRVTVKQRFWRRHKG